MSDFPSTNPPEFDQTTRTELEAAAFRRLVAHFQERTDVQNIDLMILSGFCRNCLSKWYSEEAQLTNIDIKNEEAREIIYGMPYQQWKEKYQQPATKEQLEIMKNRAKK